MTIDYVVKRFVQGNPIKGAYMGVEKVDNKETLYHRWSGTNKGPIAEIVDRKENGDFTLIIHPHVNYGKTTHNNRVWAVLMAVQGTDRRDVRFSSFVRYDVIVYDRTLSVEYHLTERPLKMKFKGGKLSVDYAHLENHVEPKEEVRVVEPSDNNNIKNEMERLTNILATV